MPKRDREQEETDSYTKQIDQVQAAIQAILLFDKPLSSSGENLDPDTAAAINAAFTENVKQFDFQRLQNTLDAKATMDIALKTECIGIVRSAAIDKQHVMSYKVAGASLPSIPQLLDLARYLSHISLCDNYLFLALILEIVEVCTVDEGTELFLFVEECIPYIKSKFNFESPSAPAKLRLLQMCNLLLRRLSRAEDVLLAGRIHLFLSQILPSTDKSAVNANGSVNDSHAVEIEDVEEGALDTNGNPINVAFYKQFWSLQSFFQNPSRAVDPNAWVLVHSSIKAVLAEFAKAKCTVASSSINSAVPGQSTNQEKLTVKYLSSPKLLNLQLQDAGFRRHFLVQCLVLLQAGTKRSGIRQETLRIKQQGEAEDLEQLLYKELARTHSHGAQFSAAMKQLMQHEDQWADWKCDGAKSFERSPKQLNSFSLPQKRRRMETKPGQLNLGNKEMNKLWNLTQSNMSALDKSNKARKPVPTLKEFLAPVIQEMDPDEWVEEQYKTKRNLVYKWAALRQVAKRDFSILSKTVKSTGQNLEVAVQLLYPEDIPEGAPKMPEAAKSVEHTFGSHSPYSPVSPARNEAQDSPRPPSPASPKSEEEGELPMDDSTAPAEAPLEGDVVMVDAQGEVLSQNGGANQSEGVDQEEPSNVSPKKEADGRNSAELSSAAAAVEKPASRDKEETPENGVKMEADQITVA